MANKIVRYNGGTQSYYSCSDPSNLIVGKEYEVINSNDRCWQTDYTLKGIEGEYNSVWFDQIYSEANVYMAISHETPEIGKGYSCYRINFINNQPQLFNCRTSTVKSIDYLGNDIYMVKTRNSIYYVTVN